MSAEQPRTVIVINGESLTLTPKNTALIKITAGRTAIDGVSHCNCAFDHIAIRDPNGQATAVFRGAGELFDQLGDELVAKGYHEFEVPVVAERVADLFAAFMKREIAKAPKDNLGDFIPKTCYQPPE